MTKKRILVATLLFIFAISSCCFATDDTITLDANAADSMVVTNADSLVSAPTTGEETVPQTNENWVNGDLYKADKNVVIEGVVDGNVFVMGEEVTVKAEIGGDLFVMANKVTIDGGYIYSSTFVMANEVVINGITYDLYAMCNSLKLDSNGYVYRDLRAMGNDIELAGRIRRNAFIESNNIKFDESVGTIVYGNLEYSSDESEFKAPEGVVAGDVKYTQTSTGISEEDVTVSVWTIIIAHVLKLLKTLVTTLAIALLLIFITPKFVEKIGNMSVKKALVSLGIGFVSPVVMIFAAILLIFVIVISSILLLDNVIVPLSLLAGGILVFVGICSTAVTSVYFGKLFAKLINKDTRLFVILFSLLVAAVIWLVSLLPLVGGLVSYLAWAFGFGIVLVNMFCFKKNKEVKE